MGQTLYQYTDSKALAGIVENCAIRATDFCYLNDSLELSYVWNAFVARLRALAEAPDDGHRHAYSTMLDAIRRLQADDITSYDQSRSSSRTWARRSGARMAQAGSFHC
ncbi:MAG: hypothetical protein WBO08_09140 [Mycobacterium sp.]|nr:hypothetical protein [Mycobacterium sp.]